MIRSFKDRMTEDVYHGNPSHAVREGLPLVLVKTAQRKLDLLNTFSDFDSLCMLPSNRDGKACRDAHGCYSMPINEQWCIAFRLKGEDFEDVCIKQG
ncbi:MAG: type II toxin-antitoxin system RelE/ParE family toxin [Verrucomicrobia bacterium]|nr:type II toxin-antitoxin system RelE/ParE family toxin [Verrucomicrobiota bacterium]